MLFPPSSALLDEKRILIFEWRHDVQTNQHFLNDFDGLFTYLWCVQKKQNNNPEWVHMFLLVTFIATIIEKLNFD